MSSNGWKLIDLDPATGRKVYCCKDGKLTHYRTDYPVDQVIDANQRAFNDSLHQRFGNGRRVASIPLNIFYDELHEANMQGDNQYLKKWLNDSDNRAFRTFKGKV